MTKSRKIGWLCSGYLGGTWVGRSPPLSPRPGSQKSFDAHNGRGERGRPLVRREQSRIGNSPPKSDRDIGTSIGATSSQSAEVFLNPCQIVIYSDGLGPNKKSPGQNGHFALDTTYKDHPYFSLFSPVPPVPVFCCRHAVDITYKDHPYFSLFSPVPPVPVFCSQQ
jgi:hypothetical protein